MLTVRQNHWLLLSAPASLMVHAPLPLLDAVLVAVERALKHITSVDEPRWLFAFRYANLHDGHSNTMVLRSGKTAAAIWQLRLRIVIDKTSRHDMAGVRFEVEIRPVNHIFVIGATIQAAA